MEVVNDPSYDIPVMEVVESPPFDPSWSITQLARECCPSNWEQVFEFAQPELEHVERTLAEHGETTYFPRKQDLFKAFQLTKLDQVKVVILGQDPYHDAANGLPQATGMAFSVRKGVQVPSSLRNIYKELSSTVPGFRTPDHGDLSWWATQGVLLLNTCLTVKPHKAGSHGGIWMGFIKKVIRAICEANPYCIFVLWGKKVQKFESILGSHNVVLKSAHPSGLSANRGFFGGNHFNLINQHLAQQGQPPIDWQL